MHPAVQSTTAWAHGRPLDVTLEIIGEVFEEGCVEISVGARPVADPVELLQRWSPQFSFLAHHTVALVPGGVLRPETHTAHEVIPYLAQLGLKRYTIHAPTRRTCTTEREFFAWAMEWLSTAADHGMELRLETMYQPRSIKDAALRHGYHLDTRDAVLRFADHAATHDFPTPLLVDLSHLFIGVTHGDWTDVHVRELTASGLADHFHLSSNNGTVDQHTPIPPQHVVWEWASLIPNGAIIVDEAKRGVSSTT